MNEGISVHNDVHDLSIPFGLPVKNVMESDVAERTELIRKAQQVQLKEQICKMFPKFVLEYLNVVQKVVVIDDF